MLICNVSLHPPRTISAAIVETARAADATAFGHAVFITLVDDPASALDFVDVFLGEIMLEAASASDAADCGIIYTAAIVEERTAADLVSGSYAAGITVDVSEAAAAASMEDAGIDTDYWVLVDSWTYSTNVAQVDFIGLAGYTDVRVVLRNLTASLSALRNLRVSIDNGATFLTTSSYISINTDGVATNGSEINMHASLSGSARSSECLITGWNLTDNKVANVRTAGFQYIIPTSNPLNALRVVLSTGVITGGSIEVFAR